MKVLPCKMLNNRAQVYSPNFKGNNRSKKYCTFMADKADGDNALSIVTGAAVGALSSLDHFKENFPPNALKSIGTMMVIMFGIRTIEFLATDKNK